MLNFHKKMHYTNVHSTHKKEVTHVKKVQKINNAKRIKFPLTFSSSVMITIFKFSKPEQSKSNNQIFKIVQLHLKYRNYIIQIQLSGMDINFVDDRILLLPVNARHGIFCLANEKADWL